MEGFVADSPDLVVGVGASAGGLAALQALLPNLPRGAGLAVVLVRHLGDDEPDLLPGSLGPPVCLLDVVDLGQRVRIEADHLYVAPPRSTVQVQDGELVVTPLDAPDELQTPIDTFFRSLAEELTERAAAVVLSGRGTDGALGVRAIRESGGLALVQHPESASFDAMPRAALALGGADRPVVPDRIAGELLDHARHLGELRTKNREVVLRQEVADALPDICAVLLRDTNHDFRHYKAATLVRRIRRRMQLLHDASVQEYLARLAHDITEPEALFRELLVGVTSFFRDAGAFEALATSVLPDLLRDREPSDPVRVWVAGCSTGEEAYSVAMLLREAADRSESPPSIQVFATDIDERALKVARQGVYPVGIVESVSAERLARFFVRKGRRYEVRKELRESCLFSVHDLMRDPPFSRLDLICCRNLLIYLGPHMQQKLPSLFHYALKPNGYLFLGSSENLSGHATLFRPVQPRHRIAQRLPTAVPSPSSTLATGVQASARGALTHAAELLEPDLPLLAQRIVLDEFAPEYAVVNDDGQVLSLSEDPGRFLRLGGGPFSNHIVKLAHPALRVSLRAALGEAAQRKRKAVHEDVVLRVDGSLHAIRIVVQPMPLLGEDASDLYLVVFQDRGSAAEAVTGEVSERANALIEHLERELAAVRHHLEKTVQDLEAANEELKSGNEELLSMNEELQSANEEQQASKEELQDANERLVRANTDLENLVASTGIATVFLDQDLAVLRYTPAISSVYPVVPSDLGRKLAELAPTLSGIPELPSVPEVEAASMVEHRVDHGSRIWLRRVLPYRMADGRHEGLVVHFLDVTELERATRALRDREERLRLALEAGAMGTWEWNLEDDRLSWDAREYALFGIPPDQPATMSLWRSVVHEDDRALVDAALERVRRGERHAGSEFRVRRGTEVRWLAGRSQCVRDGDGRPSRVVGVHFDVTDRRSAEEQLRRSEAELRSVADAIPSLVVATDPYGRVVWHNQRAATDPDLGRVDTWLDAVYAEDADRVREAWAAAGQDAPFQAELRVGRSGDRWLLGRGVWLPNRAQFVLALTPIDEQKRAQAVLKDASRRKDEFLAMLAHELRNPLAAIATGVRLLELRPEPEAMRRSLEALSRQTGHMARMLDDLLDVGRITQGKLVLQRRPMDLLATVRLGCENQRALFSDRGQRLVLRLPDAPVHVSGDPVRLEQVLVNLLHNASKYTDLGGTIEVNVAVERSAAILRVRDDGIGIAPDLLPRVFELFVQADRGLDRSEGGLGIGLTVVRRLVELHEGEVLARSSGPGHGSTFEVRLPLAEAPERSAEPARPAVPVGRRVLLVEDNADIADLMATVLEMLGCAVTVARDGPSALGAVDAAAPEVVLLDLGLPGMDGLEVARRLRAGGFAAKLVALSGYGQPEDRVRTRDAGFDAHLVKPVDLDALVPLLSR